MKALTLVALFIVILAASVSALKCFRVEKPSTTQQPTTITTTQQPATLPSTTTTTTEQPTTSTTLPSTTTIPLTTKTTRIYPYEHQKVIGGSKVAVIVPIHKNINASSDYCKTNNGGGRLFWVETPQEKAELISWFSMVWANIKINSTWVYRVNGFETNIADVWVSDTNQPLIPEMVPPPLPTIHKCLTFSGDTGEWTSLREDCTTGHHFVCEYRL